MGTDLRAVALARGGVFTASDASLAGVTRGQARTLLARGAWVALGRGVYAERPVLAACAADRRACHALRTAAAIVATSGRRFATGGSAACVLGLETLGDVPDRVVLGATHPDAPGTHGYRSGAACTLRSHVPPEHVEAVFGVDCTVAARTAVDLARTSRTVAGVVALDSAARQFGCTREQLRAVAVLQAGWPYARRLATAIDLMDERSESVLETLGRLSLRPTSLPRPLCQAWIGEAGPEVRVDFLLPGLGVVGEADGRLKYTDPSALWAEKRRQEYLEGLGFVVVRFTWQEATSHPRLLADRFLAAAARGRPVKGRVFPDPAWWVAARQLSWDQSRFDRAWWLRGLAA